MTQTKIKIQRLTLAAFFVAVQVIMATTPIGYIPIGALSITTMHLPVILAGILCGPAFGAGIGFIFGLTSFLKATFAPTPTSFVFTPFITIGTLHGSFWSILIAFGPRIFLGWFSGTIFSHVKKKTTKKVACIAAINTMVHTFLVLGMIWIFYGQPYAATINTTLTGLAIAFFTTIATNGVLETILATIVIPVLYQTLSPMLTRME